MSRIAKTFETLDRPALVTFITAGDPDYGKSLAVLKNLPAAGADIIELGMPFSDPMADGPAIQLASQRALNSGANMGQTLRMVREFRESDDTTPIVLMGYANTIFAYGTEKFITNAAAAGVDGLIIVDLPPEEDEELRSAAKAKDIDIIRLITPTTDEERLNVILEGAGGFLYYVSITGVTGTVKPDLEKIRPHVDQIREKAAIPVAIGFGIKTPEDAAHMAQICDAVVVGSAIVQTIADNAGENAAEKVSDQVGKLAQALRH